MFSDLAILKWQIAASALMGVDYFMPRSWRERLNNMLVRYFTGVQGNIDADIKSAASYLWGVRIALLVALLCLAASWAISHFFFGLRNALPTLFLISVFAFIVLFGCGIVGLSQLLVPAIIPFLVGGPMRGVITFLTKTEKGPLAGIGFLCLIISFAARYANQTLAHH